MADFNKIFAKTLGFEGGVDETIPDRISNRGVTQDIYNTYLKDNDKPMKDVREITYGEARDIGKTYFWDAMKLDKLDSPKAQAVIFDYGYNSGGPTAIKALQETIGTKADGIFGKKSMKAYKEFIDKNGEDALVESILNNREDYLTNLAVQKPEKHAKHYKGWMNRINSQRQEYLP